MARQPWLTAAVHRWPRRRSFDAVRTGGTAVTGNCSRSTCQADVPFADRLADRVAKQTENGPFSCIEHTQFRRGRGHLPWLMRIAPPDVLARNQRNAYCARKRWCLRPGFFGDDWQIIAGVNGSRFVCSRRPSYRCRACDLPRIRRIRWPRVDRRDAVKLDHDILNSAAAFLAEPLPPAGTPQSGTCAVFVTDPAISSLIQIALSRTIWVVAVVDDERYPASFEYRGNDLGSPSSDAKLRRKNELRYLLRRSVCTSNCDRLLEKCFAINRCLRIGGFLTPGYWNG